MGQPRPLPGDVRGVGAERVLGTYAIDEDDHPLLTFDDAPALVEHSLRPTDVVIRNRPRTQEIAADAFAEDPWSGLSWWSMHRPQWTLHVLWDLEELSIERVEELPGHSTVLDAADRLAKHLDPNMTVA